MLCQFFPFRYGDDNLQCAEIIEFFLNLLHILADHLARYMVDRRVSDRLIQPRLCHTPDAESSIDYNSLFCSKRHFRVNQCFICHIRIIPAVFSDGTAYFFGTSPDIQQFQIQNNALWRMDFHFLYFFPGKQHKRRSPRCRCSAGTRRISHAEFLAAAHNICIFQACPAHVFLLNRSGGFSAGSRDLFYHNTQ